MSEFDNKAAQLSPELYERFKTALEIGKWPDGRMVSDAQKQIAMEAVIIYEHHHVLPQQHLGAIQDKCRSTDSNAVNSDATGSDDEQILTLQ